MLERLHEHMNQQLQVNARIDTIFVVTAVLFDLVLLGVNSGVAAGASGNAGNVTSRAVLVVTLIFSVLVNGIAVLALQSGRQTRLKLLQGLLRMYEDAGVRKYYDESLLSNYDRRYLFFTLVIGLLGLLTIVVPLVIVLIR
jgi:hypothetical protein